MNLIFKHLIIHNFGSYQHAELALEQRGFCLVAGRNNYRPDNADSNGSGKSFIWNAICFALTGATIGGLRSNLRNINPSDDSTFVTLELQVGTDTYVLTRSTSPKSDLKILQNGVDISGKGIKESTKILEELLPNLTKDLLASTIILGQGMPHKFSSFTPSGRKELLEKLTKADFMITDIKDRVEHRRQTLSEQLRTLEDNKLVLTTQLNIAAQDRAATEHLLDAVKNTNYTQVLQESRVCQHELAGAAQQLSAQLVAQEKSLEEVSTSLLATTEAEAEAKAQELVAFSTAKEAANSTVVTIKTQLATIEAEISRLAAIQDVCPTCGQKLPGVVKPDTSELTRKQAELRLALATAEGTLAEVNQKHIGYLEEIKAGFKGELDRLNLESPKLRQGIVETKRTLVETQTKLAHVTAQIESQARAEVEQQARVLALQQEIVKIIQSQEVMLAQLQTTDEDILTTKARLEIIRKMETLTKRDFRGFLLINIIDYLAKKAKEYSEIVFGTDALELYLDNNALEVSYLNKALDNLSGGERTRVDLILQLAIRDLMYSYFGCTSNILVLDEVTDFLDKRSCERVLELICNELKNVESVFIVSHRAADLDIAIDSEILVIKSESGISEISSGT